MARLGVNKDYLKKRNRGLVLQLIATGRCTSRIELAKELHLTKAAISAIVNELLDQRCLQETKLAKKPKLGRTPIKLEIGPDAPRYMGVCFGRGHIDVAICSMDLKVIALEQIKREWKNGAELMEVAFELIEHMLKLDKKIIAIGVAVPGPVDTKKGRIINPGYFHGIHDLDVKAPIEKKFGIPVFLEHDMQSAILEESLFGNGRGYQDMLLVGIDEGVGSGIMIGGRRYQSNSGYPPEIGHFSIDHHGEKCICGNTGCLETYVGARAVEKKAEKVFGRHIDYQDFCQMEDSKADKIMQEVISDLACAIISLQNIMNFDMILLGMYCIYWQDKYVWQLENLINDGKFENKKVRTLVKKVKFMDKMMVLGAACNAMSRTFEGEL